MAACDDTHQRCATCDTLAHVAVARFELALAYEAMAERSDAWSEQYRATAEELRAASVHALELAEQHRLQHGTNTESRTQPGDRDNPSHDPAGIDQVQTLAPGRGAPVSVDEYPQPSGIDQRDVAKVDHDVGTAGGGNRPPLRIGELSTTTDVNLAEQL